MAWIGPKQAVHHYLSVVGADRGDDGRYVISGEPVVSGLGGEDLVVPDGTVYFVGGRPKNLAAGLSATSQGVGGVKVYGVNPLSTVTEMRDATKKWLKRNELWSKEIEFWTPSKFNKSEYGRAQIKAWGSDYALDNGFVIAAEGTRFAHALAYGDSGGDIQVYRGWEKLLKNNGWWWRPLAVWAIYVYPTGVTLRGNPARAVRFHPKRSQNPIPEGQREKTRKATKRFDKKLAAALKDEKWSLSIRDEMPTYTVVVYVEDCPGKGDFDRRQGNVLQAFQESGLDEYLYFDGTDYGPLPGPAATPASIARMGCPERGYHFYDAGPKHPPGVHTNDPGYAEAAEWERDAIEQTLSRAAEKNPRQVKASKLEPGDVVYTAKGPLVVRRVTPLRNTLVRVSFEGSPEIMISPREQTVDAMPESNPARRDVRELLRTAQSQGCGVVLRRAGHYQVRCPGGGLVTVSGSPSNRRAVKKIRADLRRAGVVFNPDPERHREAFADYVRSADAHLDAGIRLLEQGDRKRGAQALRHAECDIRQAYTEAVYGKRDSGELERMTGQVTILQDRLQRQIERVGL